MIDAATDKPPSAGPQAADDSPSAGLRPLELLPAEVVIEHRADGSLIIRSPRPLQPYPRSLGERLRRWAETSPDRLFLAERAGTGWRMLHYGEAQDRIDRLAQGLVERGLGPDSPLMILSENSVDQALLTLAAMQVGVPVAPISPAYSLLSHDLGKLRAIATLLRPGMCYVADTTRFARAIAALSAFGLTRDRIFTSQHEPAASANHIDLLLATPPGPALSRRSRQVGPDTVAKILFTSGSTGQPKGVINTQRMLCANQQAIAQAWPFLAARPPIVLDWLPWSHTFGGNHNFNLVLFHGGSLYIDDGRPAPNLIEKTARNLQEVSPTLYFNVPRGFDMLLPYLEADPALRDAFFRDLDVIFYAAASLSQPLWERLLLLGRAAGHLPHMFSAWGSTETAPMVTTVHFPIPRAGVIGLPAPGTEVKLVPSAGKHELRVRGPSVTPGYHQRPDLTAALFDEEGFLLTGDAGRFADPADPRRGIVFDGRIAEDFKLSTGTFVHVGALRVDLLARTAPLVQDAVFAGHDRDEIGVLFFPSEPACRRHSIEHGAPPDLPAADVYRRQEVREFVRRALRAHNRDNPESSRRIGRALFLSTPPSIDTDEITDKGYINQRAVLSCRADQVARLYQEVATDDGELIVLGAE